MTENGRLARAKVKNQLQFWKESFLVKSASYKTLAFSEDYAGKFNLSHAGLYAGARLVTLRQTQRQTDYSNSLAHARQALTRLRRDM